MAQKQDYQRWDRVWQRVAPELDPYPEERAAAAEMEDKAAAPTEVGRVQLGTFLEEARRLERRYGHLARVGPAGARRSMEKLAARNRAWAGHLAALYFVAAGEEYRPRAAAEEPECLPWREILRRCVQEAEEGRCRALAAARSAGEGCLGEAFTALGAEWKEQEMALMRLLEKNILA